MTSSNLLSPDDIRLAPSSALVAELLQRLREGGIPDDEKRKMLDTVRALENRSAGFKPPASKPRGGLYC